MIMALIALLFVLLPLLIALSRSAIKRRFFTNYKLAYLALKTNQIARMLRRR
jgi:hypothetical protein